MPTSDGILVYLACAIDKSNKYHYQRTVEVVMQAFQQVEENCAVFLPGTAYQFSDGGKNDRGAKLVVRKTNERVLKTADVVLVVYEPDVETWGVSQEIRIAYDNNQRVVVVYNQLGTKGFEGLPIYLELCTDYIFGSLLEAAEFIHQNVRNNISKES